MCKSLWEPCDGEICHFVAHLHLEGMKRRGAFFLQKYGILPYRQGRQRGITDARAVSPKGSRRRSPRDFTSAAIRRDSQYTFSRRNTQYCSKVQGMRRVLDGASWAHTHHLNGCLGAARVAYNKIPRQHSLAQFQNWISQARPCFSWRIWCQFYKSKYHPSQEAFRTRNPNLNSHILIPCSCLSKEGHD